MLKHIYSLFVGLLLATFVGVGVATFWPAPTMPTMPTFLEYGKTESLTDEQEAERVTFEQQRDQYLSDFSQYNRLVSIATIAVSVGLLIFGLLLSHRLELFADGLLYGGVFLLLYSIIRGFMSEIATYRFLVTSIGLVVALVLGYFRFTGGTHARRSS